MVRCSGFTVDKLNNHFKQSIRSKAEEMTDKPGYTKNIVSLKKSNIKSESIPKGKQCKMAKRESLNALKKMRKVTKDAYSNEQKFKKTSTKAVKKNIQKVDILKSRRSIINSKAIVNNSRNNKVSKGRVSKKQIPMNQPKKEDTPKNTSIVKDFENISADKEQTMNILNKARKEYLSQASCQESNMNKTDMKNSHIIRNEIKGTPTRQISNEESRGSELSYMSDTTLNIIKTPVVYVSSALRRVAGIFKN
ncbi:uncharacterized protein CMU_009780 [Cryptosporidium muris RN66]|uniref:Uncharacterized protein n=1 Tax=Cryptosporidium muris (strain RN66) TaxID=441375 RepID=B6AE45_CRYMR|nr:uncharacterized protein CMU_009780 [Cryptosporidium muris RN66]EEA06486.1 hypothetical protein CMU_009780 [Cryptosporidium muris RN66]|eukprot:XP_002140835.1 hypothetical protein [Cryptosporidium muris RN66]